VKILQICPRVPYPPVDGGTIGMFNLSNSLVDKGAEVKVLAFNTSKHFVRENEIDNHYRYTHRLETVYHDNSVKPVAAFFNLFSDKSYNIERFRSPAFADRLKQVLKEDKYDIVQIDYLSMTIYIDDIRSVSGARIILRAHNVEFRIWERLAGEEKNFLKKWYLQNLAVKLKRYEKYILTRIDALVTLTEEETDLFFSMGYNGPVCVAPTCFYINDQEPATLQNDFSLFHLGAMDWRPNQEGMEWFLKKVWTKVNEAAPSVKLYIAGNKMPDNFFSYASSSCFVQGRVDNAAEFMKEHTVMIVPLLAGSGIRVKIVEGMALGKAIISTSQGAEGLHYTNEKNILIADTPREMIDAILKCYSSPELCQSLGNEARKLAENYYDMKKVGGKVIKFYAELLKEKNLYI
jgi:glycosyltransferase involved in cell wall biosynthesis